ncbi:hypothetical protein DFH09DRAFT_1112037 [Mycena vulgaris]|nr:hypothetical protein DFH09DRAFT_1112037 [Mycena vulgaris]
MTSLGLVHIQSSLASFARIFWDLKDESLRVASVDDDGHAAGPVLHGRACGRPILTVRATHRTAAPKAYRRLQRIRTRKWDEVTVAGRWLCDGGRMHARSALRRGWEGESVRCGRTRSKRRGGIVLGDRREVHIWEGRGDACAQTSTGVEQPRAAIVLHRGDVPMGTMALCSTLKSPVFLMHVQTKRTDLPQIRMPTSIPAFAPVRGFFSIFPDFKNSSPIPNE